MCRFPEVKGLEGFTYTGARPESGGGVSKAPRSAHMACRAASTASGSYFRFGWLIYTSFPWRPRPPPGISAGEGPELVAEEVERHRDGNGDRLRADVPQRGADDQRFEDGEIDQQRPDADGEKARRLKGGMVFAGPEGPDPVPEEVVGDGDREGGDRSDQVMNPEAARQAGEDDKVDQVPRAADDAELEQLPPARRPPG